MPAYTVVLPAGAYQLVDGNNACVVFAGSTADAKVQAAAFSGADAAPWDQATVTEIVETAAFAGLKIAIGIEADTDNDFTSDFLLEYIVPSGASADTVDEIGDLLVAALNATAELAGVTYTSGSDTITIVGGNNCGLSAITAKVYKSTPETDATPAEWYEVTSLALTVGAVGGDASSDRTIVITPLSSGVNPAFVCGYKA